MLILGTNSSNAGGSNNGNVNSSDIFNGSDNNNTRPQLCPVATGSNINIDLALSNFTAGLGNNISGGNNYTGGYAVGIVNNLGAAGQAVTNGFSDIGQGISNAATDVYNGAANAVRGTGNLIGDAAYKIGNFFSSNDRTVTTNNSANNKNSSQNIDNTVSSVRRNISDILTRKTTWSQADGDYNDVVVNLRVILYLNQKSLAQNVKIDNSDIDINNNSRCSFIASGAYPSNSQACVNGFNIVEPYLVDFAAAAAKNDTVAALYWILQILPGMADLSNACLNTGFIFEERSYDSSQCTTEIEDLANTISDLERGNYFSSTTQQLRNRYIITRHVPAIVAYCLGTNN